MSAAATWSETQAAYQRLFADAPQKGDAAVVLADLKGFCAEGRQFVPGQPDVTAYNVGIYRVWQRIEKALARADFAPPPPDDGRQSVFGDVEGREIAPAAGPLGAEGE